MLWSDTSDTFIFYMFNFMEFALHLLCSKNILYTGMSSITGQVSAGFGHVHSDSIVLKTNTYEPFFFFIYFPSLHSKE